MLLIARGALGEHSQYPLQTEARATAASAQSEEVPGHASEVGARTFRSGENMREGDFARYFNPQPDQSAILMSGKQLVPRERKEPSADRK